MPSPAVSGPPAEHPGKPPRPLRRLALELFGVIALKIGMLLLIWCVVFAPQPKPDVSPAAVMQRLAPSPNAPQEARP
jgi:hypothetical protein